MSAHTIGGQTVDQLILRTEAAERDPSLATLEGRAMEDVRATVFYLAAHKEPQTVLWGLMESQFWPFDTALLDDAGRDAIEIGVKGNVDPINVNKNGDRVIDILEGLVGLGFVERAYKPDTVDALLLPEDDHRRVMNVPLYRLATVNLPPEVQSLVTRIKAERTRIGDTNSEYEAKRAERKARGPLFKRLLSKTTQLDPVTE